MSRVGDSREAGDEYRSMGWLPQVGRRSTMRSRPRVWRSLAQLRANAATLIVVLTDGLDTNSGRRFGPALIRQATDNNTSLYTIAYGADADEQILSSIALQSNGSFYKGNEADIAAIYQEMSTAFGGNVGIGR